MLKLFFVITLLGMMSHAPSLPSTRHLGCDQCEVLAWGEGGFLWIPNTNRTPFPEGECELNGQGACVQVQGCTIDGEVRYTNNTLSAKHVIITFPGGGEVIIEVGVGQTGKYTFPQQVLDCLTYIQIELDETDQYFFIECLNCQ